MEHTQWNIDLASLAWSLAARAHKGQRYAGHHPGEQFEYLKHIGGVLLETIHALSHLSQVDADLAVACAILHDTVEDTWVTLETINEQFGPAIAAGVSALTKNPSLGTKHDQMLDSLHRIRQQPKEVWMVKMADRIVNLSPPPHHWNTGKIETYYREAQLIHDHLSVASTYLGERLRQKIEAYQKYFS